MDIAALIMEALRTGSPALAPVFAVLWWLERSDNRQTMKEMAGKLGDLAGVLAELRGRLS